MIRTYLIAALAAIGFIGCSNSKDEPDEPKTDTTITVSESAIEITSEAQTVKFTVTSTANWDISTTADWCKLFPSGGIKNQATEVTATVTANTAMEARTATVTITGGGKSQDVIIRQNPKSQVSLSVTSLSAGAQRSEISFTVTSNTSYNISSSAAWLSLGDTKGEAGEKTFKATVDENTGNASREATITVAYGNESQTIKVTQLSDFVNTPDGYTLVWSDEFNDPKFDMPDESRWWYEVWAPGFVNNELQRYVAGKRGDKKTAEISNGILKIHAIKDGNEVISARVNTKESWTYGYFEARLKLPKGKGTWPAFWMMPKQDSAWPACGEIDIMEEVGYHPNYTSSSIHCAAYNHVMGTQRTAEVFTAGAEDEFHVYALEWTEDYIRTYVDGKQLLNFTNDKKGDNDTWPFSKPFYLKLNLAWGGDWGGAQGVDESFLPATYEIDYVRVFKKN